MRTRVKICGITKHQDALHAAACGVDAIGLVFYAPSPRAVNIVKAKQIVASLPAFVSVVALFVDPDANTVLSCLDALPIDIIQFHGDESPEFCERFNKPYIKAIRMQASTDLTLLAEQYASASALLLDSYQADMPGGTGISFDWNIIGNVDKPIILAGGLDKENIAEAIHQVKPYAVDVSGGVELAKGIKSQSEIRAFMKEVIHA